MYSTVQYSTVVYLLHLLCNSFDRIVRYVGSSLETPSHYAYLWFRQYIGTARPLILYSITTIISLFVDITQHHCLQDGNGSRHFSFIKRAKNTVQAVNQHYVHTPSSPKVRKSPKKGEKRNKNALRLLLKNFLGQKQETSRRQLFEERRARN